ncbi:MAG: hypothetical protein U0V48_17055 [Anaerolineales bacterium]
MRNHDRRQVGLCCAIGFGCVDLMLSGVTGWGRGVACEGEAG